VGLAGDVVGAADGVGAGVEDDDAVAGEAAGGVEVADVAGVEEEAAAGGVPRGTAAGGAVDLQPAAQSEHLRAALGDERELDVGVAGAAALADGAAGGDGARADGAVLVDAAAVGE